MLQVLLGIKYLVLGVSVIVVTACSSQHQTVAKPKTASQPLAISGDVGSESQELIGGWAPVFFTGMDKEQLENIAEGINQQQIKRAVISYPTKMQSLATKIQAYLEGKTRLKIPLKSIELRNTPQVKYNLTQVIVTLYFN